MTRIDRDADHVTGSSTSLESRKQISPDKSFGEREVTDFCQRSSQHDIFDHEFRNRANEMTKQSKVIVG